MLIEDYDISEIMNAKFISKLVEEEYDFAVELARKMLVRNNYPIDKLIEYTGLSIEIIENLQKTLNTTITEEEHERLERRIMSYQSCYTPDRVDRARKILQEHNLAITIIVSHNDVSKM